MFKIAKPIPLFVTYAACWIWLAAFASPAAAGYVYWQYDPATPGDWFDAANWDQGVPIASNWDRACIDNGGTAQIAGPGAECYRLYVGYTAGHSGTLELSGNTSSLWASYYQYVGYEGTGTFIQNEGNNVIGQWYLYVGYASGSNGTYELHAGELSANGGYVGYEGTGTFVQYGGSHAIAGGPNSDLYLGYSSGSTGTYELHDGELSSGAEYVGYEGTGTFVQSGGANTMNSRLYLGYESGATGTYELHAGELSAGWTAVGHKGAGTFIQSGGVNTMGSLSLGYESGSSGTYVLHDGALSAYGECVGNHYGSGTFVQYGGSNTIRSLEIWMGLRLAEYPGSTGTYELHDGELSAEYESVGLHGTGTFVQYGGINTVHECLTVGSQTDSTGTYELHDGELSAEYESVGYLGTGTFVQNGGNNTISDILYVGCRAGSTGTYELRGGKLSAGTIEVGTSRSTGVFGIYNPEAVVTVHSRLCFGTRSMFTAVPGSTIHMMGSALENESTDPNAMAGLANLTLIFEGGSGDVDPFEVAGVDLGAVQEGFDGNFALDTLQLGGEAEIGQVRLVDLFDNQPGSWVGSEALYVDHLLLGDGSYLDLNGLNLYYRSFTDLGGTIEFNGGGMFLVPEPSAIILCIPLCLAGILLGRRKHRRPA